MREGKIGSAVIPNNTVHWKIDQLIIDHLGARHAPDFFGDRVFPHRRDADEIDDGVAEIHTGAPILRDEYRESQENQKEI